MTIRISNVFLLMKLTLPSGQQYELVKGGIPVFDSREGPVSMWHANMACECHMRSMRSCTREGHCERLRIVLELGIEGELPVKDP